MKKILLFTMLSFGLNAQVVVYETTKVGTSGVEISSVTNGPATQMGDGIVLAGTQRFLNSITVSLFSLNVATAHTVTMTLYTNCPSVTGAGVCGSGTGTLIPSSSVTVNVTPTAVGVIQDVVFPYSNLDLSGETDNTITVMINASRENVFWTIGETVTTGAMPAGETGNGFATRCGSTGTNNGCARNFAVANNFQMTVRASGTLSTEDFVSSKFSISPNPVKSMLSISNAENININSIAIADLNGRVIKEAKYSNVSNLEVDLSELSSGMYIMNINSDQGVATKKIVKE